MNGFAQHPGMGPGQDRPSADWIGAALVSHTNPVAAGGVRAISRWENEGGGVDQTPRGSLRIPEHVGGNGDRARTDLPERFADPSGLDPVVRLVHDLRSPLGSILLLSELLLGESGAERSDRQRRYLELLHRAAVGLDALLAEEAEREAERPIAGSGLVENGLRPFSIRDIVASVADVVGPLAETRGLALHTVSTERACAVGNPSDIRRVLLNLATNALKFTEEGYVEIAAVPHGDTGLLISVRDTGGGLPPSVAEALRRPPGLTGADHGGQPEAPGLGLGICRQLVRSMGADLHFETEEGRGTRVHFTLGTPLHARS